MTTPGYWLNHDSRTFLSRGYLLEGETAEQRIRQIAEAAERYLKDMSPKPYEWDGYADTFEQYMLNGWISLASPVWSNFGRDRGLPISCNGSYIDDSIDDILFKTGEVGKMTQLGAGTSAYFGAIRPRGSIISSGGKSDGPVHYMGLIDSVVNIVSQSNVRRGNCAVYLPVDHPDIKEFLELREEGSDIHNLSLGVCVPDQWMREMINGDAKKRKIWARIIQKRSETGYPYIFFTDTVNNNKPVWYKDQELKIHASNLCLAGDQRVVTDKGYLTAEQLYKTQEPLTLTDGFRTVSASPMFLKEIAGDVYEIVYSNGLRQKVTGYHGIPVIDERNNIIRMEAKDLRVGDHVAIQTEKGLFGKTNKPDEAFLLGLYQGDGTQHGDAIHINLWEPDFDLIDEVQRSFEMIHTEYGMDTYEITNQYGTRFSRSCTPSKFRDCHTGQSNVAKKALISRTLKKALNFEKGVIPDWIWTANETTTWQYIRGLFYADGTVNITKSKGEPVHLSISNIDKKFLEDLQLILNNLGLTSYLNLMRPAGVTSLPNGKGGVADYPTMDCWRLVISDKRSALEFEEQTKFLSRKGVAIENRSYRDNRKKRAKVVSVTYLGQEPVYCPEVQTHDHIFVSQGLRTFNCAEIALPSSIDESFVCCLSSINLLHYDEWRNTNLVEVVTVFLDTVIEEYIRKTANYQFMSAAHEFARRHRAIGIGVLGYHSFLQSKSIAFESEEARKLNVEIHKLIDERSFEASADLAKHFGEPEVLRGYGQRNATRMATAPTTSSSFILGQVSPSREPLKDNYFTKKLAKGSFGYKNPYLKKVLKGYEKDTKDTWDSILLHAGSVQHLDFLTEHERNVFKTFGEISQFEIIFQAAQAQKFVDQAQSINLMIHPDTPAKDINKLIIAAWEMGVKTLYYQRSTNPAQELARELVKCQACEI